MTIAVLNKTTLDDIQVGTITFEIRQLLLN